MYSLSSYINVMPKLSGPTRSGSWAHDIIQNCLQPGSDSPQPSSTQHTTPHQNPPLKMFRFVRPPQIQSHKTKNKPSNTPKPQSKTLDPITLFHSPSLASSSRALNILKQASTTAAETATEDQASDYSAHAKQQRGEFELEVTTAAPTSDQLRSILDYISPVSGVGGLGDKATYGVGELVKGAKDAEDAIKRFKEDEGRFVRPVVCFPFLSLLLFHFVGLSGFFGLFGIVC